MICSSCLFALSYKERVIKCCGKGCHNNSDRQKGQNRPLFNLSYEEIQKGIDIVGSIREVVADFIQYVPWPAIRTLAISSRRELEEKILESLVCPATSEISNIIKVMETKCLECLAAEKLNWKTFLCRGCGGKADHLENVKDAFKKGLLDIKVSPKDAERMAIVFTVAFLSLIVGKDPFRKEVIINGSNSLARLGLFGTGTTSF